MNPVRVYRFEDTAHLSGPFGPSMADKAYDKVAIPRGHSGSNEGPCLWDTAERDTEAHRHQADHGIRGMHFGFSSLAQLKDWFICPYGRAAMGDRGIRLLVFEVDREHVRKGNRQVIFRRDKALVVDELDLGTLESLWGPVSCAA